MGVDFIVRRIRRTAARLLAAGVVFMGAFFLSDRTEAAGEGVFVVPRVPVQAQAESATQAKDLAQAAGRRRAIDILLRRLTPEEDWSYLPRLAAQDAASSEGAGGLQTSAGEKSSIILTAAEIVALEAGFEVYDERSSSTTYRAFITYRFKPDEVRSLLKSARIPYSEAQTRRALVLPVLQTDTGLYLWESNNPWMAAWKSRPYTHELTPMTAPLGDLEDTSKITARAALDLDSAALGDIAAHYNVSQVIVAHARLKQRDGNDQLTVTLLNGHRETGKADAATLETLGEDALEYDPAGSLAYGVADDEDFAAKIGETLAVITLNEPSGRFPALAEKAIDNVVAKYASGWKRRTLIDHATETLLPATAFFNNLDDWSRIRSALIATPLIGSVQISALSRRGAEMNVRLFGEPSRVQVALENQGVVFWTETGERWFIATPAVATQFRGRRFLRGDRRGVFGEQIGAEDRIAPIPASATSPIPATDDKIRP